ncbi:hypothetical protein HBI37_016410 [Parastagonospora nodorum]|nr:hypothetical protein HBH52_042840 [Parastagonospora nodorum]KAH3987951.1 hypothetical protein HBH51_006220 [Parastagonospora nodorum]KAH5109246.1 hypothetical protein HBH72_033050 [Parastagonospora nodorum]KAH5511012.1 hypothetical protein HBI31_024530 [Parastagonospora nodorum]KAH6356955.1 hypothetical protein HBI37_016410 [Parastagonospora nodorum]
MLYGKGGWLFRISQVTLETMVTTSTPITRNEMNSIYKLQPLSPTSYLEVMKSQM